MLDVGCWGMGDGGWGMDFKISYSKSMLDIVIDKCQILWILTVLVDQWLKKTAMSSQRITNPDCNAFQKLRQKISIVISKAINPKKPTLKNGN